MAIYLSKFRCRMVLTTVLHIFLLFSQQACSPPSTVNEITGEVDGALIYKNYCKSCHGPKGNRGLSNAADLSSSKLPQDSIRHIILYGTDNGMSAYKAVISKEEDLDALVKHVKSLQKN